MEGSSHGLQIRIAGGVGSGPTELSAFDDALDRIGIGNFNLILLSSIVPAGADVSIGRVDRTTRGGHVGDRLYVVLAEHRTSTPGREVWAGLGWTTSPANGQGMFVEHSGTSRHQVEVLIETSLDSMEARRPDTRFGPRETHIVGGTCGTSPICAAVVAVFGHESWNLEESRD